MRHKASKRTKRVKRKRIAESHCIVIESYERKESLYFTLFIID